MAMKSLNLCRTTICEHGNVTILFIKYVKAFLKEPKTEISLIIAMRIEKYKKPFASQMIEKYLTFPKLM